MAPRKKNASSKLKDIPIGCSWIPTTPAKPDATPQQPICVNWSENHPVPSSWLETQGLTGVSRVTQTNWSGSGQLPADFLRGTQCQTIPAACYSPINPIYINEGLNSWQVGEAANSNVYEDTLRSFDTWQAHETTGSQNHGGEHIFDKFSVNEAGKWSNLTFRNLLDLAHARGNTAAQNVVASTSSNASATLYHPHIEGYQSTMRIGNSSVPEVEWLPGVNFDAGSSCKSDVIKDGSSNPSRPFIDLNSPPRNIIDAALGKSISFQFEPITPEKTNKADNRVESTVQDLSTGEVATVKHGTENRIATYDTKGKNEKKQSEPQDQLSVLNTSSELQENHKPDMGGTEEADLSKTPPQKPRRKKHRPKVIIEGQHKSTPKPSSEKTPVPQETPRVKRKYVRKKGVNNVNNNTSEGETNENDELRTKDTPSGKRQYARKSKINETDSTLDKGTLPETTEIKTVRVTRSSCRRSLNFNLDDQVRHESSRCPSLNRDMDSCVKNFDAENQSRTTVHGKQVMEEPVEKSGIGISSEVHSTNNVLEGYLASPHGEGEMLHDDYMLTGTSACTRGKCQIIFSDVTHDKEINAVHVTMNSDSQWISNDSICSNTCPEQEKQERGLKRQYNGAMAQAELSNTNAAGMHCNSLQAYLPAFSQDAEKNCYAAGMYFPIIHKKKRTEKAFDKTIFSLHSTKTISDHQGKLERHGLGDSCIEMTWKMDGVSPATQSKATTFETNNLATDVTRTGKQVFYNLSAFGTEGIKKKRSKGPIRVRDLASLFQISKELPASPGSLAKTSQFRQQIEIVNELPARMEGHESNNRTACMEALAAHTRSTMTRKKRSKRSMHVNSVPQHLSNYHQWPTKTIALNAGPPLAITWKCISPIDSITEQLNQLDLNATQKRNAYVTYDAHYQENALVPYQRGGAVIPFDGSFDQVRRRKPRPKVDLDDETTRVWKLLLENINSEGIDGTDEEKTKWWEEERRVFRGRADSFIARMHLVQGDRRFSPWKGSVIDSVVGVFLTQNVSDHLSSSAFMSLAARFPLRTETALGEFREESVSIKIDEPEVIEVIEPVRDAESEMLPDLRNEKIITVNSVRSSRNSSDGIITIDDLGGQCQDVPKHGPAMSHESDANRSRSSSENERDMDDILSSQTSVISSQSSAESPIARGERTESCLLSNFEEELANPVKSDGLACSTSFVKLLQMAGTVLHGVYEKGNDEKSGGNSQIQSEGPYSGSLNKHHSKDPSYSEKHVSCCNSTMRLAPSSGECRGERFDSIKGYVRSSDTSSENILCAEITEAACQTTFQKFPAASFERPEFLHPNARSNDNDQTNPNVLGNQTVQVPEGKQFQENKQCISDGAVCTQDLIDVTGSSSNFYHLNKSELKEVNSNKSDPEYNPGKTPNGTKSRGRKGKEKINPVDWDNLRRQAQASGRKRERTFNTMDSVDWDAVRCSDVNEIAQTIKERGMNNMLAERIKDFLNRVVRDHGSIDLEWLRDVPPDKAKEYLLSIRGLGLKSVECVRLLTLHHLAFPVDTNVGRIAVRLGWVPLQPLPESLQLHLLELYPVLESIQKYLWPRLCKLDQRMLYELHYQMITFGKVFCTKSKPNCNACPMRAECRHFASAFASARLALPTPEEKSIVSAKGNNTADQNPISNMNTLQLPSSHVNQMDPKSGVGDTIPIIEEPATPEPTIEMPATPEPGYTQVSERDIEDAFYDDPDEIPTIQLNMEEFTHNLQKVMQENTELQEGDMSKALVALTSEAASIPVPKLKNVSRLRTEHQVYELPDSHPLLEGLDRREPDDPCPYLLAIWTPGETANSIQPPERRCCYQEPDKLCMDETCVECNSIRELNSQTVRGTLLIPCRTAMRGSFPLNGTYFQVNEVFSDHESSLTPMDVPREWLWNLPRRTVYFGTSIPTIFKGLTTEGIQYCFWRGFVCVRGFDRKTRAPRPLIARLHFPASKLAKGKGKTEED